LSAAWHRLGGLDRYAGGTSSQPSRSARVASSVREVLLVVLAIGLVLGLAADRLLAATEPGLDPANAMAQFGFRGPVLAARAVFVFSAAVLIGTVVGRALPALIFAGIVAVVGIVGGTQVHDQMLQAEAVVLEEPGTGDRWIDQRFRLPDGSLIGHDVLERYDPSPAIFDETTVWPTLPVVVLGIPGTRYGQIQLREVGALAGGALVAVLLTALVVQRRRPG
jgi:hypothetical protein